MTTEAHPEAAYDPIADWYAGWLGDGTSAEGDPYYTPLRELIGDVSGQHICDLACGEGRVSRHLAEQGAHMVGADPSAGLLAIAERHEASNPQQIEYRHDNAHSLTHCQDAEFDGVILNMALMDIPDLSATLSSTFRVLRPDGWFAFSVLHPCFNAPQSAEEIDADGRSHRTVTDYFTEGFWKSDRRVGPIGKVGAYHRTMTTYLTSLIETGFIIQRVREIAGPSAVWQEVPPVLAVVCRKP